MKILHVVSGMDPKLGGVCQAVRTLVAGLAALQVHSEVVSLDAKDAAFLAADPFILHALGPAKGPWAYNAALLPWLTNNLPRFDAVVVHGLWSYHGYAVRRAVQFLRRKSKISAKQIGLFVMPHGMLDPYFQQAADRKFKAIRNIIYWKVLEQHLIREADAVLFTCEEERIVATQPFSPYQPKDTAVVGLGVQKPPTYTEDMRHAFLTHCPAVQDEPYLLFLSRIHQKKGVDLLINAYAKLTVALQDTSALPKLVIAGPGLETAYGHTMQELVESYPAIKERVLFPGMLTGLAKWGAFYGCEAFILPSHQENFGIAVVEALACGKPVLISDKINIWREIKNSGGGMVAEDTVQGAQSLLEEWRQTALIEKNKLQQQAVNAFEDNFSVDRAAQLFYNAIHTICFP